MTPVGPLTLPSFVRTFPPGCADPSRPALPQYLPLCAVSTVRGLVVNAVVGHMAGAFGQCQTQSAKLAVWLSRASAVIFAGLALKLALLERG
ncbi:MAG: hypothetical protein ACOH2H_20385 [Cypionkella sp.]